MSSEGPSVTQRAAKFNINVPDGLRPLLESLAREVIRNQPVDIYTFTLVFADNLLKTKQENGGVDPISTPVLYDKFKSSLTAEAIAKGLRGQNVVITVSEQAVADEPRVRRPRVGRGVATPERAATTIQAAARGFVCRRRVKRNRRDLETARDTRAFKTDAYDPRRQPRRRRRFDASGHAPENVEQTVRPVTATNGHTLKMMSGSVDQNQAATKIQAGVRGFLTRRKLSPVLRSHGSSGVKDDNKDELSQTPHSDHFVEPVIKLEDVDASASKIQAGVRGYLTRKHLEEKGLPIHHPGYFRSRSHSPNVSELSGNQGHTHQEPKLSGKSPGLAYSHNDLLQATGQCDKTVEDAASRIQAGIRGFLTRKHLQEQGVPVHSPHQVHLHREQLKKEIGETSM